MNMPASGRITYNICEIEAITLASFFISHYNAHNIRFKKMPFYSVEVGVRPGIYSTWTECESIVKGFPGAKFKK